jgi:magnesium-transporting ATPase (P-type)
MQTIGSSAATDLPNICFMGSSIMSGAGTAVVIQTGAELAGC